MPRGEKRFGFLASPMVRNFYGAVTVRFENGKVSHVQVETRQVSRYKDLPAARGRRLSNTGRTGHEASSGKGEPCAL
jgi:hypothetical protein